MNNKRVNCLITGCRLRLEASDAFAIGDLFLCAGAFYFNANVGADGSMTWYDPRQRTLNQRELLIPVTHDYFERRGALVTAARRGLLNAEARAYIGEDALDELGVEQ